MKIKKNITSTVNALKLFTLIFFLNSCETLTSLPSKILETGSDTVDYVGSIFEGDSDEEENENKNKNIDEILSAEPNQNENNEPKNNSAVDNDLNEQQILDSDQVLEAVPAEDIVKNQVEDRENEFDPSKVILENSDSNNRSTENKMLSKNETLREEMLEVKKKILNSGLNLENKIQFKIGIINFTSGSSALSFKDKQKIRKIISLASKKNAIVKIVGHASTRTKDMPAIEHKLANFNVSDKRAQSVAREFIRNKFPSSNLITEAVSDSRPLFHESMPAGTFGNQRTEIYLIY